ncbi:hypothetical protein AN958_06799 [Leucoagaricus sp. SymC.cos]|nr:hypothetical protein AN958_06799 [Leucoagaricus sp. SymC.cos]
MSPAPSVNTGRGSGGSIRPTAIHFSRSRDRSSFFKACEQARPGMRQKMEWQDRPNYHSSLW